MVSTTRDLKGALERSFEVGDPPDLAGLPGPGYMLELVRKGRLVNLTEVIDTGTFSLAETAPGFVDIGTVEGELAGVFMKATVKGLFWYNPEVVQPGRPETWDDLQHDAVIGQGGSAPGASGSGPTPLRAGRARTGSRTSSCGRVAQVYDDWVGGRVRWSSPEIHRAFPELRDRRQDAATGHGLAEVLRTHFSRAGDGLFTEPPTCLFAHQATFMSTFLDEPAAKRGGRYDFIPFPDIEPRFSGALIAAGDLFALVNDTPAGRDLIRYLVSTEAQEILVQHGGAMSGNLRVTEYPTDLARRQAELLATARILRFDASNSMPDDMNEAFWQAVLDFTADQSQLDQILVNLDAAAGRRLWAGVMRATGRAAIGTGAVLRWSATLAWLLVVGAILTTLGLLAARGVLPPSQRASCRARWGCRPSP